MKRLFTPVFIFLSLTFTFGQVASDYFPAQTGYKWNYELIPLDSLNNTIDSLKFYGVDSFFVNASYNGKDAKIVASKTGTLNSINVLPFTDSLYFSFDGSNGFEYFDPFFISGLLGNLDSTLGINFFNFFRSLEGWYSYYRFANSVNQNYTVFTKDTTVNIDSTNLPLRFQLIGKRLEDENLSTEIGTFSCKKFLLERRLSYLVSIPPLPTFAIKILGVEETVWLAPANWKVKSYIPSTIVDLSIAGGPLFSIPGLETNIKNQITSVNEPTLQPVDFELFQNYPNPFNPSTTIKYSLQRSDHVSLKVYDMLGNEIMVLVNEVKSAGEHYTEINNIDGLSSGVYLYELKIAHQFSYKKMILIK